MLTAMYGFKRAPKIWNGTWNLAMRRLGFGLFKSDECFYFINISGSTIYALVYIDDVLVLGVSEVDVTAVKKMLMQEFEMKDLGIAKSFLRVEFIYNESGMSLRQEYCIRLLLENFGMMDCKPVSTPISTSAQHHQGVHRGSNCCILNIHGGFQIRLHCCTQQRSYASLSHPSVGTPMNFRRVLFKCCICNCRGSLPISNYTSLH